MACAFTPRKVSELPVGWRSWYLSGVGCYPFGSKENTYQAVLDLGRNEPLSNMCCLQEYIPEGQRVQAFKLEVWKKGNWQLLATGTTIGNKRIVSFEPVRARKVRLTIEKARAIPLISEVQVF